MNKEPQQRCFFDLMPDWETPDKKEKKKAEEPKITKTHQKLRWLLIGIFVMPFLLLFGIAFIIVLHKILKNGRL